MKSITLVSVIALVSVFSISSHALTVRKVGSFADMTVRVVSSFPDCTIRFVSFGGDYHVREVSSFADVTVQQVTAWADVTVMEGSFADVSVSGTRDLVVAAAACPQVRR